MCSVKEAQLLQQPLLLLIEVAILLQWMLCGSRHQCFYSRAVMLILLMHRYVLIVCYSQGAGHRENNDARSQ